MEKSSDDGDSEFERIQQEDQLASPILAEIVDVMNDLCAQACKKPYVGTYQAFLTGFSEFYTLKEMEIYMGSKYNMPVESVEQMFDNFLTPNSGARTAYLKRALRCKADRDRKAKEEATAHSSGIPPVTEQNEKEASEDSEIEEDSEQKETALDVHTSDKLEAFPSSRRPPVTEQIEAGTEDQSSDTDRETEPKEEEASEPKSLTVPEKKKKKKKETTLEAHKSVRPPGTEQIDAEASQVLSSDSPSETEQKESAPEVNSFDQKESSPVVNNSDDPRVTEQEVAGLAVHRSDRPHRVSADSVSALVQDLFTFQITSKVPEGLGRWVVSSQKVQENWYSLILQAWMQAKPLPQTVEDASRLVTECLQSYPRADVLGILSFYGLPVPQEAPVSLPLPELPLPEGVIYQFQTLPVDKKAVVDGDGMTVYVSSTERVFVVPPAVILLEFERAKAYEERDFEKAGKLSDAITVCGYRALKFKSVDYLARKYKLRLRGIDAPESEMAYGEESRVELVNIVGGKCLRVLVYCEDQYGRLVSDLYCDGVFVQEVMLRNGHAWHYSNYDKRIHFAEWQEEAKQKRIGLWASPKPEKPWDWRSRGKM